MDIIPWSLYGLILLLFFLNICPFDYNTDLEKVVPINQVDTRLVVNVT